MKSEETIRINQKEFKVFSIQMIGSNHMILETDFNLQKELSGDIFNFNMLSMKNRNYFVKFKKRSKRENTMYVPIPPELRNNEIQFGHFARCYIKDDFMIFETRKTKSFNQEFILSQYNTQQNPEPE